MFNDLVILDANGQVITSRSALIRSIIASPGSPDPVEQNRPTPATSPTTPRSALLVTAREAAKMLSVCEKTLWSLTDRGEIPVLRIGRSVRYDPRDLNRWIEKSKSIDVECFAAV